MFYPKISIITITYNSEKTLEETIQSVIRQDYPNLEYIIIDGGSNDGTLNIVEKYKDKIAIVISEPDNGISDAFNKGVRIASGDLIGIINSDDLLVNNALKYLAESYDESVDVYRGKMIIWDADSSERYVSIPTMDIYPPKRISSVCHPSTFITNRAYKKYGLYNVNFRYMMDVDILYRLSQKQASFKYINKELAIFREGGATSDNWKKKRPELIRVLKENGCSKIQVYSRLLKDDIYIFSRTVLFSLFGKKRIRLLKYNRK